MTPEEYSRVLRARGRVHVANALRDSPSPPPRAGSTLRTPAAARAAMLANAEVDAFYGTPRSAERRASPGHYALESPLATPATLPEIRAEPLRASRVASLDDTPLGATWTRPDVFARALGTRNYFAADARDDPPSPR